MNIKQALQVPITLALEKMNANLHKEDGNERWYKSPFRQEKTASLHVHTLKNVWYDFGESTGGDVIKLVCKYLETQGYDYQVPDALRWLRNMTTTFMPVGTNVLQIEKKKEEPKLIVKSHGQLRHVALIYYLSGRGIPESLARKHTQQVYVLNRETGKGLFAVGFRNDSKGWELRNSFFKGCIAPKTITFIRGLPKPDDIHIFEGFMDYLSILAQSREFQMTGDCIVLNSLSCLSQALPYLKDYGYKNLYTWLDNDHAGQKATETFAEFARTEEGLVHRPMNARYRAHKDVNEWHMRKLNLPPL